MTDKEMIRTGDDPLHRGRGDTGQLLVQLANTTVGVAIADHEELRPLTMRERCFCRIAGCSSTLRTSAAMNPVVSESTPAGASSPNQTSIE